VSALSLRIPGGRGGLASALGVVAVCSLPAHAGAPPPQDPAFDRGVVGLLHKAARWQLARIEGAPIDWNHAVFYLGLAELARLTGEPLYLAELERVGAANRWRLGRRRRHADDHAIGQAYLDVHRVRGDGRVLEPLLATFDGIARRPGRGREEWGWCDALFMAAPVWAELAAVRRDPRLLDTMDALWWDATDSLFDPEQRLFLRDRSFVGAREANGERVFWARGNGWVIAALARLLADLPADDPRRARYQRLYVQMADRLAGLQRDDGFWSSSLLDPASYPAPESSGTSLITYALAWGLEHGLLDPGRHRPVVERAWAALAGVPQPGGRLGWVQPAGRGPAAVERDSTEPFGVGAFLLAGSAVARLHATPPPAP
jgi:unsaturated rhamnogalacturonyl hydrolase